MRPSSEAELAEAIAGAQGPLLVRGGGTRTLGHAVGEVLETGGLSGAPIFDAAQIAADYFKTYLREEKILIRAGGVDSAEKAQIAFDKGADLLQIYTGFVYGGLRLLHDILKITP